MANTIDDAEAIRLIVHRDEKGLRWVIQTCAPRVKRSLEVEFQCSPDFVDDAVSEALLKVWNKIDRFDSNKGTFAAWFFCIAKRKLIDILRLQHSHTSLDATILLIPIPPNELSEERRRLQERVQKAVEQLPLRQRQVIEADSKNGGSANGRELALWLKVSIATIHTLRHRAKTRLRGLLESWNTYDEPLI